MKSYRSLVRLCAPLGRAALALLLLAGSAYPAAAQATSPAGSVSTRGAELARRIEAVIDRRPFHRVQWGISVWDPAARAPLYRRNADRRFIPASNLKLVVAATAAHVLDPEYRYRTTVHAAGPLRDGVLEGDLVLYGRGDPMISGRYFESETAVLEMLADSLLARGVRRVTGGVTADESWFDTAYVHRDWDEEDLLWWYAAPVGALGFNDNAVDFLVQRGRRAGDPARIIPSPESGFYRFENRARTAPAVRPRTVDFGRTPGTNHVWAHGDVPIDASPRMEHVAIVQPAQAVGTVFREALERRGIRVGRREVRVVSDPRRSPAATARVLARHLSPTLPHVIGPILGSSQNWFSEQLVKTLGKEVRGEGSWAAGLAVERAFLTRVVGIDSSAFVLRDASGLSAGNRITPDALVRLLEWARTSPSGEMVRAALPVSARSGSLRSRFTDLPGRVAAKTGYIGNVDSLSGYVKMADGRELVFSIIANGTGLPSSRMKEAIDQVVRVLATHGGR